MFGTYQRLGLHVSASWRDVVRASHKKLTPKARQYVKETFGKAQAYWDAWCEDVAEAYGRTPQEISDLHLSILSPNYVPF